MRVIEIRLPDVMYEELVTAVNVCRVGDRRYSPADFVTDCVTSELATRRLLRGDALRTN